MKKEETIINHEGAFDSQKTESQVAIVEKPNTLVVKFNEHMHERVSPTTQKVTGYDIHPPEPELMPFSVMRAHLRSKGLKGRELTAAVEACQNDFEAKRELAFDIYRQQLKAAGFVYDGMRINAKMTRALPRFIKPKSANEDKLSLKQKLAEKDAEIEALKAKLASK